MARQKSSYSGVGQLRRKLRMIPEMVDGTVRPAMTDSAQATYADMVQLTPVDQGDLRAALSYRVSRDGMAAQIGVAADKVDVVRRYKGKLKKQGALASFSAKTMQNIADVQDYFYFRFLDRGTKGFSGSYIRDGEEVKANIPAMPALNIRERALDANRNYIVMRLSSAINRALKGLKTNG